MSAERAFLRHLQGGCQVPIAALAGVEGNDICLDGLVASLDGVDYYRDRVEGPAIDAEPLGKRLAERLIEAGADKVLRSIRS